MSGQLTATYASVLALIFVMLSVRTLLLRRKLKVGVGDGGDPGLIKAARAHGNFAEYTPICLILLYFLELTVGATNTVHFYGICLVLGRLVHAYGCLLYTSPSPRDGLLSRMPSSA